MAASRVICDVAGGIGTLLAAILEHRAGARGILIDAPDVLAEAEGFLRRVGSPIGSSVEPETSSASSRRAPTSMC